MDNLSVQTKIGNVSPLTFQLKSSWDEATEDEKEVCVEKPMEGCSVVWEIIAPNAGDELLQSCVQLSDLETECASGDLVALVQAYKNTSIIVSKMRVHALIIVWSLDLVIPMIQT